MKNTSMKIYNNDKIVCALKGLANSAKFRYNRSSNPNFTKYSRRIKMSKIILTADSGCDLGPELIDKYDVRIIPIHVTLDGKEYLDGVGMTAEEMLNICDEKNIIPKTSALNPIECEEFFAPLISTSPRRGVPPSIINLSLLNSLIINSPFGLYYM